jgi:hypothetical protein
MNERRHVYKYLDENIEAHIRLVDELYPIGAGPVCILDGTSSRATKS